MKESDNMNVGILYSHPGLRTLELLDVYEMTIENASHYKQPMKAQKWPCEQHNLMVCVWLPGPDKRTDPFSCSKVIGDFCAYRDQ